MNRHVLLVAATCALALPACTAGGVTGKPLPAGASKPPVTTTTGANGKKIQVTEVRGVVVGPVGYKAGKGAPVPGATAATGAPAFRVAQQAPADDGAFKEEAIAEVQVYLASAKGERFAGPSVGTTNVKGEFTIKNVPLDLSFLVMTNTTDPEQRHKELCAPMQNTKTAQDIKISYGSTIVVLNTLQNAAGNALGQLNGIYFQLTAAVDAKLAGLKLSQLPDVNDPQALADFMATVDVNGVPAPKLVADLRSSLATGVDAATVQKALDQLNGISFAGAGSATANGQTAGGSTAGTITIPPDLAAQIFGGGTATPASTAPEASPTPEASPSAEPSP